MFVRQIAGFLILAVAARAQETRLSGPVSGFVFDPPSHSLRLIVGLPGASYLGAALADGLDAASVSPDGRLAITAREGFLDLIRLGDGSRVHLGTYAGAIEEIAWHSGSKAAALRAGSLRLFRVLDGVPEEVPLARFSSPVRGLVVEDDAIVAASPDGLWRVTRSEARLVAPIAEPAGLALAGESIFVATRGTREVLVVRGWRESAEIARLAGDLEDPAGLGLSADGARIVIADRGSRQLLVLDSRSGALIERLPVDFEATRVTRSGSLFLLNTRSTSEPLQVYDPAQHSVFFIPAQDLAPPAAPSVEE